MDIIFFLKFISADYRYCLYVKWKIRSVEEEKLNVFSAFCAVSENSALEALLKIYPIPTDNLFCSADTSWASPPTLKKNSNLNGTYHVRTLIKSLLSVNVPPTLNLSRVLWSVDLSVYLKNLSSTLTPRYGLNRFRYLPAVIHLASTWIHGRISR